ncbi:MAG: nucleoside-diphosphate kinase [Planctomycetes bacterium]|nr:nucleoside-diphosphate kinase [Planctomycetota bacterium]
MAERTLIIIKPDAVQRHLVGEIISRFENKGLKIVAAKFLQLSEKQTAQLYAAHVEKAFYKPLVKYISSSPMLVMILEADGVIDITRKMMGATFGYYAEMGTIRGDFSSSERYNLIHGSDSIESAQQEIKLFFAPNEIVDYNFTDSLWLYGKTTNPKK